MQQNTQQLRVIIVGGVAGGMSAATRLRRLDEHASITVIERGEYVSFANCGLPYYLSGTIAEREKLLLHTPQSLQERFAIEVLSRHEVTAIHTEERQVSVTDLASGTQKTLAYDKLILSPGASAIQPKLEGAEHAFVLRNVPDMDNIKAAMQQRGPRAVVIGGGFIGLEVAENLREAGKEVTLIEAAPQVLAPLDREMAILVQQELERCGVKVRTGVALTKIVAEGAAFRVELQNETPLVADMVVMAIGVRPEDGLARAAGLEVAERGGIVVNEQMLTSDPHIYAVGDAALVKDALGQSAFVPLAWAANRQGRLVADHIAGREVRFGGHPTTAIAKVFELTAASTGLNEKQVRSLGLPVAVVHTHPASHAGYYPRAQQMHLKLVFDPQSGRIYGAQAVGQEGTDKRIDVLATAIHSGLSAPDLADLPLAYAPPYGSAKDPVNMLGYVAQNVIDGTTQTVQWHEVADCGRLVVDVRDTHEFARGHIAGALNIPLNELRQQLEQLRGQSVLVHCQVGQRGHTAARLLSGYGIDAANLDGGYLTWQAGQKV